MLTSIIRKGMAFNSPVAGLVGIVCVSLLSSCATSPTASQSAFRFRVLRYQPPVQGASWPANPAMADDPEGTALKIAAAMQHANVEQWLSSWEVSDRPNLSAQNRASLLAQWQPLKGRSFTVLGRVVAGADVIVELAVVGSQCPQAILQLPLKRSKGRWWLDALEPSSEYLHWETSPNKIVDYIDPNALQKRFAAAPETASKR
ncbi:MAG: hypothetical protein JWR69_233 [Pedosphaera sp.]|nr:hypothetical protein [Pedosphaera sp.]